MSRTRFIALLLVLGTLLLYLPVCHYPFVNYDDDDYVTNNPIVQNGLTWSGVAWAFTTWHAANWHPLTWLSLMADCQFFGTDAGAFHAVNALFHAANSVLLLLLLLRWTKAPWPSAFGRRAVRLAPDARGVRRLDLGAQRRVEHVFRPADAAGLHQGGDR